MIYRLQKLASCNLISRDKILKSFYLVQDSDINLVWGDSEEKELEDLKKEINSQENCVFKVNSVYILSQLLLDYLESISQPLISTETIEYLKKQTEQSFINENSFSEVPSSSKPQTSKVSHFNVDFHQF